MSSGDLVRWAVVVVAAVLAGHLLFLGARRLWLGRVLPDPGLRWMWDLEAVESPGHPRLVVARGSFEAAGPWPEARLFLAGADEVTAFVNGTWVAATRFSTGIGWTYPVGDLVVEGDNELVVEVTAANGVGALMACLELAPGRGCVLGTPDLVLERKGGARAPAVWSPAPWGRWRSPSFRRAGRVGECVDLDGPIPAERIVVGDDEGFASVRRVHWSSPVRGVVALEARPWPGFARLKMLFEPPGSDPGDRTELVRTITGTGERTVRTVEIRELGFLRVRGAAAVDEARVYPARAGCDSLLPGSAESVGGVFGLDAPAAGAESVPGGPG